MAAPVDLFEAVIARIKADATCAGLLTGGVSSAEPATSQATGTPAVDMKPFAIVTEVGSSRDYMAKNFDASFIEDGSLQVSVFARTRAFAVAGGNAVAAALNDAPLTFTGGVLMYLRQTNRYASRDTSLGVGGAAVWQEIREFRYLFSGSV